MKKLNSHFCKLYIVRHGETEWNKKWLMQGHTDSALTSNGIRQAENLAKKLQTIKFSAIFSSDLLRAKRTAEIISLDKKLAVKTSKLLRERVYGSFEGKKILEVREELIKLLQKRKLATDNLYKYKIVKDVETDKELMGRFINFLREIALAYLKKKVLIVTHGGVIRTFLNHLGWAKAKQLAFGSVANTAYVVVDTDGVDFFVKETFGIKNKII